jgi:hypothetical protein
MDLIAQLQVRHRLAIVEPEVGVVDGNEHRLVDRGDPVGRGPTGEEVPGIDKGSGKIRMRRRQQRRRPHGERAAG